MIQAMVMATFRNIAVMNLSSHPQIVRIKSSIRLDYGSDINFPWPRIVIKYIHLLSVTRLEMLGKLLYYSAKIQACH